MNSTNLFALQGLLEILIQQAKLARWCRCSLVLGSSSTWRVGRMVRNSASFFVYSCLIGHVSWWRRRRVWKPVWWRPQGNCISSWRTFEWSRRLRRSSQCWSDGRGCQGVRVSELKVVEVTNFVAFLPIFVIAHLNLHCGSWGAACNFEGSFPWSLQPHSFVLTGEYVCHPFRDPCQGLLAEHCLKSGLQGCWYCFWLVPTMP